MANVIPPNPCPHCGRNAPPAAVFCSHCAGAMNGSVPAPPQPIVLPAGVHVVPVAPRYASIFEEPGAFQRYMTIGVGIWGWGVIWVIGSVVNVVVAMMGLASQGYHYGTVPNSGEGVSYIAGVLFVMVAFLIVQVGLLGICAGGVLRLVRDALHY